MNTVQCENCEAHCTPIFNNDCGRLMAWLCEECETGEHQHWFCPPTGTTWEQGLTQAKWNDRANVVDINYRQRG